LTSTGSRNLISRFVAEAVRWTQPFYDALREDRFFLGCYLVGSYLVIQILFDAVTGRPTGSPAVLLFGVLLLVLATFKRLMDVEAEKRNPLQQFSDGHLECQSDSQSNYSIYRGDFSLLTLGTEAESEKCSFPRGVCQLLARPWWCVIGEAA